MNITMHRIGRVVALAAALSAASAAPAQSTGAWLVKVGVNRISPQVSSGTVSAPALPNTLAAVTADTEPVLDIAYMLTEHVSAELDLGWPYTHDFVGDGAIKGAGKLGTAQVLPPTLFLQYRFLQPDAAVRPYIGLGATYAYFRKETGSGQLTALLNTGGPATTFTLQNKFAASVALGATLALAPRWYADVAVVKTYLKTTATYSTGQTQPLRLDPLSVSLGVTYQF